jgi:hypothetical protein
MTETPEEVLASIREDAAVARRLGHEHDAKLLEQTAARFASSIDEYLTWISEADARIRSAHAPAWFRARFPEWERQGLARWNPKRPRERQYRAIAVPIAPDADSVRADARRAAGE